MNKQELIEKLKQLTERYTLDNQSELCLDREIITARNGAYNYCLELAEQLDEPSREECEDDTNYIKSLEDGNLQKLSSLISCYQYIEELEKALELAEDEALRPTRNIETDNFKDYCILQAQYELKRFKEKSDE